MTRELEITTPLGDDALEIQNLVAIDELGRPFEYHVDLLSTSEDLDLDELLGQNVTVRLALPDGEIRYFNGEVSRISQVGRTGSRASYRATLRPWLWYLTRTADCRAFQNMTIPEIIMKIFRDHGFTDFEDSLSGSYETWEYCVQYRETDFNFVSRLMEQVGIYYYFTHEDGRHVLVLADDYGAHSAASGYEEIPYYPPQAGLVREVEHIYDWSVTKEIQTGAVAMTDFDFERPRASLLAKRSVSRPHARADMEVFDYPGEYDESGAGETYARVRVEELQTQYETVSGRATARGLAVGALFSLTGFPREDQNHEYLIVSTFQEAGSESYESGSLGSSKTDYTCRFTAIEGKQPFRAARLTPKPVVQGPQTAIVVGKSGEEIWTDKYGRVKVQFHWDRYGKADENSSCWVRVAQVWSGKNWGGIQIPRMGQEVIVEFLEGDPDLPIITGRVYNADHMPPYDLPADRTQSGIKSRSSLKGTAENFNEIRFEDKKGSEDLFIHAEKDQTIEVENDESHTVGHDRTKEIGHDENATIKHDRTKEIGNDESTTVGGNRTEKVAKDETIEIAGARSENVGKTESITIGESRSETVGKDESISIGKNRREEVGKNESVTIGENREHKIGKDDTLQVGKKLALIAADEISIQCGDATITLKKNGDIVAKGKNLKIDGSAKIDIKASSDLTLKGSSVKQN